MKNSALIIFAFVFLFSQKAWVAEGSEEANEATLASTKKEEDVLKVQENLPAPVRTTNLRAVQKQVLNITLPDQSNPEEPAGPVSEE